MQSPIPVAAATLALLAFSPLAVSQTQFVEVSQSCGLTGGHLPVAGHPMVAMVGGATVADFNADGWPDVYVIRGGSGPDYLYINQQDGTFVDEALAWGLVDPILAAGAAAADFDRDGWVDLFVTSFGEPNAPGPGRNRLYRNNGNGTFSEVAQQFGLNWASWTHDSFGAGWGDYDLDGDLDLFVANYGPNTGGNRLFRNDNGSFTEVSRDVGINAPDAHGFVPTFADMNQDRYPELFLISDTGTSRYYANNRDGSFTDSTSTVQALRRPNAMGLAIADVDGDQLLDFYVSGSFDPIAQGPGNELYMNQGNHVFKEESTARGVDDCGWGWGTMALDFDNDGLVDLGGTNGFPGSYAVYPSKLFHNQGSGQFVEVGAQTGLVHNDQGRSMNQLDFDRDGDLDILISAFNKPIRLFRNDLVNANHWLRIDLDTSLHGGLAAQGIGTRLELTVGGSTQVQYVSGGQSYLGQPELTAHFGVGAATSIDEIRVEWADGFTTVLENVAADQQLVVVAEPPLTQSSLRRGQAATATVTGAEPGETVYFLYSLNGTGAGAHIAVLGGLQLGLKAPVFVAGSAVADASGVASLSTVVPATATLSQIGTQAVIQRGAGGILSAKSNAIRAAILP
ncbi:MAG TPA: CRTAC1 family protein [Planctomycetota bacterium]